MFPLVRFIDAQHTWYLRYLFSIHKWTLQTAVYREIYLPTPAPSFSSGLTDLKKKKKIEPGGTVLPTEHPPEGRKTRWHDANCGSYMWNSVCTLLEHNTASFTPPPPPTLSLARCSAAGRRTPVPQCAVWSLVRREGGGGPCMFKKCVIGWAVRREQLHSLALTHHFLWPWLAADSPIGFFGVYFLAVCPSGDVIRPPLCVQSLPFFFLTHGFLIVPPWRLQAPEINN